VDAALGGRRDRWFDSYDTPGTVYLPLVMVDSGNQIDSGDTDFSGVYSDMIDLALERPAAARMTVQGEFVGNLVRFEATLTNASGETLSAANRATLTALLYEQPANSTTVPLVVAAGTSAITTLDDGATGTTVFEVAAGALDPTRTRWVVIADYLPAGSTSAFDTLQAVVGP
jgi:hypothetical protein